MECYIGFYPQNNVCTACPSKCHDCLDVETCVVCARGYFHPFDFYTASEGTDCLKCSSNCQTCFGHEEVCTSCVTGLSL